MIDLGNLTNVYWSKEPIIFPKGARPKGIVVRKCAPPKKRFNVAHQ